MYNKKKNTEEFCLGFFQEEKISNTVPGHPRRNTGTLPCRHHKTSELGRHLFSSKNILSVALSESCAAFEASSPVAWRICLLAFTLVTLASLASLLWTTGTSTSCISSFFGTSLLDSSFLFLASNLKFAFLSLNARTSASSISRLFASRASLRLATSGFSSTSLLLAANFSQRRTRLHTTGFTSLEIGFFTECIAGRGLQNTMLSIAVNVHKTQRTTSIADIQWRVEKTQGMYVSQFQASTNLRRKSFRDGIVQIGSSATAKELHRTCTD